MVAERHALRLDILSTQNPLYLVFMVRTIV